MSAASAQSLVLAADIGGTNTVFGIYRLGSGRPEPLRLTRRLTRELTDEQGGSAVFLRTVASELASAARSFGPVHRACFAVAGLVQEEGVVRLTNAPLVLRAQELRSHTGLTQVEFINDFVAAGVATNVLGAKESVVVQKGAPLRGQRLCLGAGTDFGASILYERGGWFHALATEAGTMEFPVSDALIGGPFRRTLGELLSGPGLAWLYGRVHQHFPSEPAGLQAPAIVESRATNPCSAATLSLFAKFFARAMRNLVFAAGAWAGVFIAGGLARRITEFFGEPFLAEFRAAPRFGASLALVPVTILTSDAVGALGAAAWLERGE